MSNPNGPVRRRRIAGEPKPALTPAAETPAKKPKPIKAAKPVKVQPEAKAPAAKPVKAKPVSKAKAAPSVKPATKSTPKAAVKPVAKSAPKPASKSAPKPVAAKPVATPVTAVKSKAVDSSGSGDDGGAPRSPLRTPLIATLALLAAAALVFAGFGAKNLLDLRGRAEAIGAAQSAATKKAVAASERVFTYQWNKLPEHTKESKALMTPAFQKEFDTIAPAIDDLAPQRKISVMAKARNAAPIECSNNCSSSRASVLVFLDVARLIGDSTTPTVFGNRIVVDMVERDGAWLVDDIRTLGD